MNPIRDKNEGVYRGKGKTPTCNHGLSIQKLAEGKTSYELGWNEKNIIKKKQEAAAALRRPTPASQVQLGHQTR